MDPQGWEFVKLWVRALDSWVSGADEPRVSGFRVQGAGITWTPNNLPSRVPGSEFLRFMS